MLSKTPGIVIGVDEAGRGCVAGPVVAAAVMLNRSFYHENINDSKILNDNIRNKMAKIIKENSIWAIGIASVEEIDAINIAQATYLAMDRAIRKVIEISKLIPEKIMIDGNRFYGKYEYYYETVIKGDSLKLEIAAASIIAKTERDDMMNDLHCEYPVYDWMNNKGYLTKEHNILIKEHSYCNLHRKTFKPIKNMILK